MYGLLSCFDFWPNMEDEIEVYVKTYRICQLGKPKRQKEVGLIQPLHIVKKPWVSILMDFISGFPSMLVVVDRFSKYAIFIITPHPYTVKQSAKLFFWNVVKYFRLLEEIISDRDTRFIGKF